MKSALRRTNLWLRTPLCFFPLQKATVTHCWPVPKVSRDIPLAIRYLGTRHPWMPEVEGFRPSFPRERHAWAGLWPARGWAMLSAASAAQEHVQCLAEVLPLSFSSVSVPLTKSQGGLHWDRENRKKKSFKGKAKVSKVRRSTGLATKSNKKNSFH